MSEVLILASASPRRRELLERVGIAVEVSPADVDEAPRPREDAVAYALRIAAAKADAVAADAEDRWVLAADTVVEVGGALLGKPADELHAGRMLARLFGRTHRVTTGYAVRGPGGGSADGHVTTEVDVRDPSPAEIAGYLASGEWRHKAGAYAVQGIAAALVTGVRGSITNVIGLPLSEVIEELERLGAPGADFGRGVPA